MLFQSSIRKELGRSFGATLVVLATVVMTIMLIRVLGQASRGSVDPQDVLLVMGYTVLSQLPTILALSLFIAIVGTLSRMYRDSEMVIWFASGRGLATLLAPLLRFSWPVLLLIAALALGVWPWANSRIQAMRDRYEQRGDIDRVAPGQFMESAGGTRVFFIDKDTPDAQSASNVFISIDEHGQRVVTTARGGRLEVRNGERFAVLSDGQRVETRADKPGLRISEFRTYDNLLGDAPANAPGALPPKMRPTAQLVGSAVVAEQAELAWRIGLAFAGVNFVVLALALAAVNPRAGRSTNLVFALFAFVLYYNLLNLGQGWMTSGRMSFGGALALHALVLALALALLAKRHLQWSWHDLRAVP